MHFKLTPDGQLPRSPLQPEPAARGQLQAVTTALRPASLRAYHVEEPQIQEDQTPLLQVGLGRSQEGRKRCRRIRRINIKILDTHQPCSRLRVLISLIDTNAVLFYFEFFYLINKVVFTCIILYILCEYLVLSKYYYYLSSLIIKLKC